MNNLLKPACFFWWQIVAIQQFLFKLFFLCQSFPCFFFKKEKEKEDKIYFLNHHVSAHCSSK
jgi:hypothetical protein